MVSDKDYIPERGDVIWISFTPQFGHEQSGRRSALILSPGAYNELAGLALMSPITSQIKGYPFEVEIPTHLKVTGVILSDQVKSLDWRARKAEFICRLPSSTIIEVLKKFNTLVRI